jgi:V-type H+-transporting ATPase subunit A
MNVGFRPRLLARPSLYDLVTYRNIERLSVRPSTPTRIEDLPPLPSSPGPVPLPLPPAPVHEHHPEPLDKPANMGPKKLARDADGEEQYGAFPQIRPFRSW